MKKSMLLTVALGLGVFALCAGTAQAGSAPGSGIMNSLHDLSVDDGGYPFGNAADKLGRACIYCHAPHHTQKGWTNGAGADAIVHNYVPLWNRPFTQAQSFTLYNNGVNPGKGSHLSQAQSIFEDDATKAPGAVSMLCLSCHDGTVGLNVYGSTQMSNKSWVPEENASVTVGSIGVAAYNAGTPGAGPKLGAGSKYNIGGVVGDPTTVDLSNHHPIGFDYLIVEAKDHEIAKASTEFKGTGVKIEDVLYGDQMECVTCHDVHNSTKGMGEKFLWVTDTDNEFCCTCHLKCGKPKI